MEATMEILVTGGAGYIGSTVCSALIDAGHTPVIIDSLQTGRSEFVRGRIFYEGDISDAGLLGKIVSEHPLIEGVIHLAALIVVPESVAKPFEYYNENVSKSMLFFNNLISNGIYKVVFSSSASIYDDAPGFMVVEDSPLRPRSPYAKTKMFVETILGDFCAAYALKAISLRYFNVIGADPRLRTGLQNRNPSHVLGKLVAAACGQIEKFLLTGTDWPTRDGTGIRDYIHVWDLARAHVLAVERFDEAISEFGSDYIPINLGCCNGVTVNEFVTIFEKVYGKRLETEMAPPRAGDVAGAYAGIDRAYSLLGWKPELTIEDGIRDALRWGDARESVLGY
jgi:UDP-glucose 4-epimerase